MFPPARGAHHGHFGHSLDGTRAYRVDTRTSRGHRIVGEWVYGAGVLRRRGDAAVYYVHGSGYALCSPRTHRRLAADAIALAEGVRTAGAVCELEVWPDQVHVFQALPRLTPEAGPAMHRIASFISRSVRNEDLDRVAG